ncbi:helix-turn-helix transcriptional regulator [Micrococcus luteus]|uniref:helix-turn-helix domain-containing protein n=1 Tax=Micrococcus luteus TaxID=1270 RepID=UPI00352F1449
MSNHTRCVRSNLAAEISRRDLTQARAAALAGLTPDGLSKRMSGQVEFRLGELLELARVLGVPFATLVAGCQGPLSSAHRRPVFLPAGGHQNCPLVASWFARLGGGAGHRDGISSVA